MLDPKLIAAPRAYTEPKRQKAIPKDGLLHEILARRLGRIWALDCLGSGLTLGGEFLARLFARFSGFAFLGG